MQSYEANTLGIKYTVQVPSTVEEYNGLAPERTNPVLEDAIDNVWYRGGAAKARDVLYDGILKAKGKSRPKVKQGDKEVDAPATRANIIAELGEDENLEDYSSILEEWSSSFVFDPSAAPRGGGGALTVTKKVEAMVKKIVDAGKVAEAAAQLADKTGEPVDATPEGLTACLAKLDEKRRAEERAAKKAAAEKFKAETGLDL